MANGTISVPGLETMAVNITRLQHGVRFQNNESENRNKRELYSIRRSSGSFVVQVTFTKFVEYQRFINWLINYARAMSATTAQPVAMMVKLPSRNFEKRGIPEGSLSISKTVTDVTWKCDIQFLGVSDAVSFDSPLLSRFRAAADQGETSQFFYPEGEQLDSKDRAAQEIARAAAERMNRQASQPLIPVRGPF